jgi:hypothetical protein
MSHNYQTGVTTEYSHRIRRELGFAPVPGVVKEPEPVKKTAKAKELEKWLSDHQWHWMNGTKWSMNKIWQSKQYLCLMLAFSDSGKYVCIPGDNTPELAPDGT